MHVSLIKAIIHSAAMRKVQNNDHLSAKLKCVNLQTRVSPQLWSCDKTKLI